MSHGEPDGDPRKYNFYVPQIGGEEMKKGNERLWTWFGLSYASFLTLPRSLMHQMPDKWQDEMAKLLEEWDETWDSGDLPNPSVIGRKKGRFTKWPHWLLNYRHPDKNKIMALCQRRGKKK